jgi:ribonuclease P protein component
VGNVGSLRGRKEFGRVYALGRRVRGRVVTVYACPSQVARSEIRLGLVVAGRGTSAVARNRIRRRLRAAFAATSAPGGFDYVVRASPRVETVNYQLLVDAVRRGVEVATGVEET